jgi:hypothetical protein
MDLDDLCACFGCVAGQIPIRLNHFTIGISSGTRRPVNVVDEWLFPFANNFKVFQLRSTINLFTCTLKRSFLKTS